MKKLVLVILFFIVLVGCSDEQDVSQLTETIERLQHENSELKQTQIELDAELKKATQNIEILGDNNRRLINDKDELNQLNDDNECEKSTLKEEIERLEEIINKPADSMVSTYPQFSELTEDYIFIPKDAIIRIAPLENSPKVSTVYGGTLAPVIDKTAISTHYTNEMSTWYYIQIPNFAEPQNTNGWIKLEYTELYSESIRDQIMNVSTVENSEIYWESDKTDPLVDDPVIESYSYEGWIHEKVGEFYRLDLHGGQSIWVHEQYVFIPGIDSEQ